MDKPMAYGGETRQKQMDAQEFIMRLLNALGPDEAKRVCRENHWLGILRKIS